jgi:O-antigen/teichoic acid export membrane protein
LTSNEPAGGTLFDGLRRKAGAVSVSRLISVGAALVVAMVLTRLLGEDAYGAYRKLWLIYAMFGTILTSTVVGMLYYRAGVAGNRGDAAAVALLVSLISGLCIALISWIGAGFWADLLNAPGLADGFRMFAPYLFFGVFAASAEPLFVVYHRKKFLIGYTGVYNLIEACLIVIPFAMGLPIERVVLIMSAGPALRSAVILGFAAKNGVGFPGPAVIRREMRPSMAYASGLLMVSVAGIAAVEADKWIVGIFFDSDALYAIYVVGAKKLPFVGAVISAVTAGVVAQYAGLVRQGSFDEALYACRRGSAALLNILLPLIAFAWVMSVEIMVVLFEKYAESAPIFRIYLFVLLANSVLVSGFVLAAGLSRVNAATGFTELLINIALSLLLVNLIGLYGPAWATLIAHIIYTIVLLVYCRYKMGIAPARFFPGREILPALPAAAAVFLASHLILHLIANPFIAVTLGALLATATITWLLKNEFANPQPLPPQ